MSQFKNPFWNREEKRLRAAWRILVATAIMGGLIMGAMIFIKYILGGLPQNPTYEIFLRNFFIVLIGSVGFYLARKEVNKKSFVSLGLTLNDAALIDFGTGLLISFFAITTFFIIQITFGLIDFQGITLGSQNRAGIFDLILAFLGIGLFVAWFEEVFFRGIVYQNIEEGLGMKLAITLSCLLYGLIHIADGNATWLSTLIIVLIGGVRLLGYLRSRQLWLSIGMHAGWNFCMAVFGYNISSAANFRAIEHLPIGPDWLSGGEPGPEGSILIIPIIIFAMAATLWWTEARQEPATDTDAAPTKAP